MKITEEEFRSIPSPNGKVIVPRSQMADVDQFHYAPVRRAGDFVYVSGVVASNRSATPLNADGFRKELRNVFEQIRSLLAWSDARLEDVVELQMFHVFRSRHTTLGKDEQLALIGAVRDEFFPAPYPAAVELGVAELNADGGLVEIKATAFAPLAAQRP